VVDRFRSIGVGGLEARPRWSLRMFAFALAGLVAFGALGLRLLYLQVAQHAQLTAMGVETRVRPVVLEADRGIIYDRHGAQLVVNQPAWALQVVPAALPTRARDRQAELAEVARLAALDEADLGATLAKAPDLYLPVTVKRGLDPRLAEVFQERLPDLPGVQLESTPTRTYTDPQYFAHVLGYTNRLNAEEYAQLRSLGYLPDESAGKAGVEAGLESVLRGRNGLAQVETDAAGLAGRTLSQQDPVAGDSVYLSIDAGLQRASVDALRQGIAAARVKAGAALVVDPGTGELLALASWPSYDSNRFTDGISTADYQKLLADPAKPLYDRALNGLYPPGSTFKMITAAAALQEGQISGSTVLGCPASIRYGGWSYANWAGYDMGPMNVERAIAVSCDTFFYRVADMVGDMSLASYARAFGYGRAPQLEIPDASAGLVPDEQWKQQSCQASGQADCRWNPGETLTMGIGQSALLTTPLIQAMYVSALANGGTLLDPELVDRVVDPTGKVLQRAQAKPAGQVPVSAANLEVVRQGMRMCLDDPHGTGYQFRLDHFRYGGGCKTGTAQYGGSGTDLPTHAWFTFFSPYDNPEIAIVVLVEGGGEGDQVAEPVAVKIADYYYAHRAQIRS
jgi:penicillin-binding protein 2